MCEVQRWAQIAKEGGRVAVGAVLDSPEDQGRVPSEKSPTLGQRGGLLKDGEASPQSVTQHCSENAARAVRVQVTTPGYLPPSVPTSLGTQPPRYLPPSVPTLGGWVPRGVGTCGVGRVCRSCAVRGAVRGGVLRAIGSEGSNTVTSSGTGAETTNCFTTWA